MYALPFNVIECKHTIPTVVFVRCTIEMIIIECCRLQRRRLSRKAKIQCVLIARVPHARLLYADTHAHTHESVAFNVLEIIMFRRKTCVDAL